jgi:DNA-directed RNA polymerase subunit RPC12/RpoP
MKRRNIDKRQDFLMNLARPFVRIWMNKDTKRIVHLGEGVNLKRKEPYILLSNHTFLFDVIHVPLLCKKVPFIVASHVLFKKKSTRFLVTQIAHVIAKSKGTSDTGTVRELIGAVKRGYPILIFPEGDTTFYGETNYIEESTMKLIKKLEIDVITCNVKGGYLSKPRWATGKRKNRRAEFTYELTIPKDTIKDLTVDDINGIVKNALYNNDYTYQRTHMIPHPGKTLAEGMENVVYACPFCESIATIKTEGNKVQCTSCGHEGFVDSYGFIQDFKYDNLIDWDKFQKNYQDKLKRSTINTTGQLFFLNAEDAHMDEIGLVNFEYRNQAFHISGAHEEIIPIQEISNAIITLRRDFGFLYQNKSYLVKLNQYSAAFLRIAQNKY